MSFDRASMRPFVWAWIAYTALVVVIAAGIWIPTGIHKEMDFRSLYAAGMLARTDPSHLYDLSRQKQLQQSLVKNDGLAIPFGHLAYDALLYVPFSFLKYQTAYLLMILCNAILIPLCFLAAREEFSAMIPMWQPRAGFIFFTFMPTAIALAQGQDSLVLLLTLCLTWRLLNRTHHFAAGLLLANLLLKPHLAVLLLLFLAVRYGWRIVAGFAAGGAVVTAICLPFLRHGGWKAWLGVLSDLSLASGNSPAQEAAMGIYSWAMPNLRGALLFALGHEASSRVLFVIVGVVSLAVLAWALVIVRKLTPRNAFAFSVIATVLVSYNFEAHDLVILLLPMVLMEIDGNKALARCRDIVLGLPTILLLVTPSTPPGAGYALISIPLLVSAFLLSRPAPAQPQLQEMALI